MNTTIKTNRKERIERQYMEEARRASLVFPEGELVSHEEPDFLLHAESGTVGIEVTELCREEPRAEAVRLQKVPEEARKRYHRLATDESVDVIAVFSAYSERVLFKDLTNSLADFVHERRKSKGSSFSDPFDLPDGYCFIGIHPPRWDPTGNWRKCMDLMQPLRRRRFFRQSLPKKCLLTTLSRTTSAVWLLIVNDQFLGPGEVYARPEDVARWQFEFDFERVLLFARKPGGGGEVIEVKRSLTFNSNR